MLRLLTENDLLNQLRKQSSSPYYAMYSSVWNGVILEPSQMLIPLDDHMVHRGDGVFEAIKVIQGRPYLLESHLHRMLMSSDRIGLTSPLDLREWSDLIAEFLQYVPHSTHLLRLFLSRGPGSFSQNPYDCPQPQIYMVATKLTPPLRSQYETGVHIGVSSYPPKPGWLATIKSCNYLPNVLMKKEAVERKLDFVISVNAENQLVEGSTENIALIDRDGVLKHPPSSEMLMGTTLTRLFELVERNGSLPVQRNAVLSMEDLRTCREAFMVGTTLDVLPISTCEGELPPKDPPQGALENSNVQMPLGPKFQIPLGPWAPKFLQWIQKDQTDSQ